MSQQLRDFVVAWPRGIPALPTHQTDVGCPSQIGESSNAITNGPRLVSSASSRLVRVQGPNFVREVSSKAAVSGPDGATRWSSNADGKEASTPPALHLMEMPDEIWQG